MSRTGSSASARPFATSGMASGIPLVPVSVPTPAPSRRSHSSIVNWESWSAAGLPKVM